MNAQEKVLEYAEKHNQENVVYTNQQWVGKMAIEGIVISRADGMIVAKLNREGTTLTITETTTKEAHEIVDGKLVTTEVISEVEVLRAEL